ncbi:hypothetical protein HHK36_029009 [Tetracentron sinense]|uniref:Uncharacterized protein n=1 Tax=Tetracentron sinense TaxID=13715 RepID=A0A834YHA3_TETSI|nr:hypothetical protein HHK36_029009 [Tetracentron sinense]
MFMDNMGCAQVPLVVRKAKKKQAKGELDRLKQAEKKKRRLEKALATSAAIRSELEKKKQRKIEEQQRLDEEGAAIAEAVALHVLGEDSDDSCKIVLKKDEKFNSWDRSSNLGLFMGGWRAGPPHHGFTKHSLEGLGWVSDAYGCGCMWKGWGTGGSSFSPGFFGRDLHVPHFEERGQETMEISAGLIAAQAVSSLQIAEDVLGDTIVINGMLRGTSFRIYSSQIPEEFGFCDEPHFWKRNGCLAQLLDCYTTQVHVCYRNDLKMYTSQPDCRSKDGLGSGVGNSGTACNCGIFVSLRVEFSYGDAQVWSPLLLMSNKASAVPAAAIRFRDRRALPKRGQIKSRIAASAFHSIVSVLSRATSHRSHSNGDSYLRDTKSIRNV